MCCGEAIKEKGNSLSRNPNLCACCSSLMDGMDDLSPSLTSQPLSVDAQERVPESKRRAAADVSAQNRRKIHKAA
jgi:hypothetical protein